MHHKLPPGSLGWFRWDSGWMFKCSLHNITLSQMSTPIIKPREIPKFNQGRAKACVSKTTDRFIFCISLYCSFDTIFKMSSCHNTVLVICLCKPQEPCLGFRKHHVLAQNACLGCHRHGWRCWKHHALSQTASLPVVSVTENTFFFTSVDRKHLGLSVYPPPVVIMLSSVEEWCYCCPRGR